MKLKFRIVPDDEVREPPPQWWLEYEERQREHHSKHPHCIGCGRFVEKNANVCADCYEGDPWY